MGQKGVPVGSVTDVFLAPVCEEHLANIKRQIQYQYGTSISEFRHCN